MAAHRQLKSDNKDVGLTKLVQIGMHPQIHKEVKIATLREDFATPTEWLHYHLCQLLGREDLIRED